MLIDTNQLVSLTKLRKAIGDYVSKAKSGSVFYITEKGEIQAMITPVRKENDCENDFFTKMDDLRKRAENVRFTDKRDSTEIIREMRDKRYGS